MTDRMREVLAKLDQRAKVEDSMFYQAVRAGDKLSTFERGGAARAYENAAMMVHRALEAEQPTPSVSGVSAGDLLAENERLKSEIQRLQRIIRDAWHAVYR